MFLRDFGPDLTRMLRLTRVDALDSVVLGTRVEDCAGAMH
jgi:hypothetical protein